jgi:hypothetical protein
MTDGKERLKGKELKIKDSFGYSPASDDYQAKFDSPHFGLDPPKLSASPPHSSKQSSQQEIHKGTR